MKPTKNRVFCKECGRVKMLFETEKKAQLFMKFNNEEIAAENGHAPTRAYFCESCGGWHLTHIAEAPQGPSRTEKVIEQMIEHQNTTREIMRTQHEKVKAAQKENEDYVTSQLSEIDKLIEDKEYSSALELLDALLEMSKTKFIRPKLLKQVRKKKEFVIWMSNSNGNN